ncbi:hypothetical protein OE88DRAFT_432316 [Heliocybe sulcata]|uniref:Uncharacterized protein n=1 Tax=Heliocybe sulcata TaxID=5364 RepID=A0A5C3MWE0_9AGAM|nr:hypothetical protein OE88DRAFT_432316 [Heliocybe sulcata]
MQLTQIAGIALDGPTTMKQRMITNSIESKCISALCSLSTLSMILALYHALYACVFGTGQRRIIAGAVPVGRPMDLSTSRSRELRCE